VIFPGGRVDGRDRQTKILSLGDGCCCQPDDRDRRPSTVTSQLGPDGSVTRPGPWRSTTIHAVHPKTTHVAHALSGFTPHSMRDQFLLCGWRARVSATPCPTKRGIPQHSRPEASAAPHYDIKRSRPRASCSHPRIRASFTGNLLPSTPGQPRQARSKPTLDRGGPCGTTARIGPNRRTASSTPTCLGEQSPRSPSPVAMVCWAQSGTDTARGAHPPRPPVCRPTRRGLAAGGGCTDRTAPCPGRHRQEPAKPTFRAARTGHEAIDCVTMEGKVTARQWWGKETWRGAVYVEDRPKRGATHQVRDLGARISVCGPAHGRETADKGSCVSWPPRPNLVLEGPER